MLTLLLVAALVFSVNPSLFSSGSEGSGVTAESVAGDISIRRNGSNYTLKNGLELFPGDEIIMGRTASCEIVVESRARMTLDRYSRVTLLEKTDSSLAVEVPEGAVFFDLIRSSGESPVTVRTAYASVQPETGAVFSVEAYAGTQTVNLYSGEATLIYEDRTRQLAAGDHVSMVQFEDRHSSTTTDILASELSEFLLEELIDRDGFGFDVSALRQIIDERAADTQESVGPQRAERMSCTVEVRCDTVMSRVKERSFGVPRDGVILAATPVKFTQGESAYDVLRRVCRAAGLSLEYKYYPMIGGYYITEIGGLAESDFGPGSGWLFKVNGWFPNYGASKHEVEDGDVIVWLYSCDGGTDLGREEWMEHEDAAE